METLSTFKPSPLQIPAFKPPPLPPPSSSHQPQLLLSRRNSITSNKHQTHHHQHQIPTTATTQAQVLTKPQSLISSPLSATITTTRLDPASGYAAALLDVALCKNSAEVVFKDATRFSKLMRTRPILELMRNPFVDESDKREVMKDLADKGRFEKHLVALVKMLIGKKKQIGMIGEVLNEFGRMYSELCVVGKNRAPTMVAH